MLFFKNQFHHFFSKHGFILQLKGSNSFVILIYVRSIKNLHTMQWPALNFVKLRKQKTTTSLT